MGVGVGLTLGRSWKSSPSLMMIMRMKREDTAPATCGTGVSGVGVVVGSGSPRSNRLRTSPAHT